MKWPFYLAAAVVVVAFFIYKQLRSRLNSEEAAAVSQALAAGARIIDVRTPAEYAAGHVPGGGQSVRADTRATGPWVEEVSQADVPPDDPPHRHPGPLVGGRRCPCYK